MPIGSAPPDPNKDPMAYIRWLYEQLDSLTAAGDLVGARRLLDKIRDTIEQL